MSVKKTIRSEFEPLYFGFNKLAKEIHCDLVAFSKKLEDIKKARSEITFFKRLIVFRNWLTHFLLWLLLVLHLSSCFVSGRTIHVATPRLDIGADTITAFTFPYKSSNINY